MDFDTTIVENFEPIACIIATYGSFYSRLTGTAILKTAMFNVYTRKTRIASTIPTRTKAFLGFKVASYTFYGTFMLLQNFHKTTTLKKVFLARKRIA